LLYKKTEIKGGGEPSRRHIEQQMNIPPKYSFFSFAQYYISTPPTQQ